MSDPTIAWAGATLLLAGEVAAFLNRRMVMTALVLSALAELGYVLMGFGIGGAAGDTGAVMHLGYQLVMRGLVFLSAWLLIRAAGSQRLEALAGSGNRRTLLSVLFAFGMFSVLGLSPFKGSFTKFLVLYAAIEQGRWALAALGTLASMVAALTAIVIIQGVCFAAPAPHLPAPPLRRVASRRRRLALWALSLATVGLTLVPDPFLHAAQWVAGTLGAAGLPDFEGPWSAQVLVPYLGAFLLWPIGRRWPRGRDALALTLAVATLATAWIAPAPDALSLLFARLFAGFLLLVVLYSSAAMARRAHANRYYFFLFLMIGSLLGTVTAHHLGSFYVFWELMTWSSYFLVVHDQSERALKAGLRYFVMCTAGAYVMHFGILLLHAQLGTFSMAVLAARAGQLAPAAALVAVALMMVGLAVKAALFPLHAWLPEAHPVAPPAISAPLSGVLTKAGVYGLAKLLFVLFGAATLARFQAAAGWPDLGLIVSYAGAATLVLGEARALFERETKRMLAWSTLAQVGAIAIGLGLATVPGVAGALLHTVNHAAMKGLAFLAVGALSFRLGGHTLDDLKGAGRAMPVTGACLAIAAVGLIGLPPLGGFVSKFLLVYACAAAGQPALAALILAGGMLAAVYYARLVRLLFFAPYEGPPVAEAPRPMRLACLLLAAVVVVNGVLPGPSLALVLPSVAQMAAKGGLGLTALPPLQMAWTAPAVLAGAGGALCWLIGQRRPGLAGPLAVAVTGAALAALLGAVLTGQAADPRGPGPLGYGFAAVIAAIGLVNLLHSVGYTAREPDRGRYFFLFLAMIGGLLGMALSTDLFSFFAFWEVMSSWSLYFLIIHEESGPALAEGFKYYLFNMAGAALMFLGVALLGAHAGTFALVRLPTALAILPPWATLPALLLLVAGLVMKAAMLPWRIDVQMHPPTAPTPVSGFISAVLLKAGPWGVLRLAPLLAAPLLLGRVSPAVGLPPLMFVLAVVAAVTAVYAGAMAVLQSGIKRLLIYSTVCQLAHVLLGVALGSALGVAGGLLHLVNHALLKDALFLAAGGILLQAHAASLEDLGGLGRRMPLTFGMMLFAGLSVAGLPPLNGFASKWLIYQAAFQAGHPFLGVAALLSSLFTLAAVLKFAHAGFLGPMSPLAAGLVEPRPSMVAAMALLTAASLALSVFPGLALVPIAEIQRSLGLPAVAVTWLGPLPGPGGWHPGLLAGGLAMAMAAGWLYRRLGASRRVSTPIHSCGVADLAPGRLRVPGHALYESPQRFLRLALAEQGDDGGATGEAAADGPPAEGVGEGSGRERGGHGHG